MPAWHSPAERRRTWTQSRCGVPTRTFLDRHRDLLAQIHVAQTRPTNPTGTGVSHARCTSTWSIANERATRQASRFRLLENKLSELLGDQAWRDSELGAPDDIDHLKCPIAQLEQQVVVLTDQLTERNQELDAARADNRDLINQLNRG